MLHILAGPAPSQVAEGLQVTSRNLEAGALKVCMEGRLRVHC